MHKQHEDQPSNELPNLSPWHRVPVGATIPKGTPYAYVRQNCVTLGLGGGYVDIEAPREGTYYTEHPILPPLPTEEGASIVVASDAMILDILLVRAGECWFDRDGNEWPVETIRAWAPVTIGEVVVMP